MQSPNLINTSIESVLDKTEFTPAYMLAGYGSYGDYLNSEEWAIKKQSIKSEYPKSIYCWICDSKQYLELHHENYASIPREKFLVDVFWICRDCHKWLHTYEDGGKVPLDYHTLRERRLYMRHRYLMFNLRPTTAYPIIKQIVYRMFW